MKQKKNNHRPAQPSDILKLVVPQVFKEEDFTYYLEPHVVDGLLEKPVATNNSPTPPSGSGLSKNCSIECTVQLSQPDWPQDEFLSGRASLTKCFNEKWFALTIRKKDAGSRVTEKFNPPTKAAGSPALKSPKGNGWHDPRPVTPTASDEYLFSISHLCEEIWALVKQSESPGSGLIVVSGATNSAKSKIARGLMVELLHGKECSNRRHHVITLEDPPEEYLLGTPEANTCISLCQAQNVDYTVRFVGEGKDCPSLEAALQDARRQTPALFYYGEVRNAKDWRPILDFAGSGHLIVTTTHAGSLVESLQHIAAAVGADTPAEIGALAGQILASVHLRSFSDLDGGQKKSAVLPALWRRNSASVAQLVADGFSSVLPHNPQTPDKFGSFGRYWFANKMKVAIPGILREALQCDLESR